MISSQSFQECLLQNATTFLGKPYINNPLGFSENEPLTYSTDSFDCVTFVETVTALTLHQHKLNEEKFSTLLSKLRFRNGIIDGYGSRIHYFSEWLQQVEVSGLGKNITLQIGGESRIKKIHFMSTNAGKYPPLRQPNILNQIKEIEAKLSQSPVAFIPKQKIPLVLHLLQDGDIVAFTSSKAGLDIHHVGFVAIVNNSPHIVHASQSSKKVEISNNNISDYVKNRNETDGIIVFRFISFEKK